jgi:imidazolonepropionase-like amidohydrolase
MKTFFLILLLASFLVSPSRAAEPAKPLAFKVGRLYPASAPPIDHAVLVVAGGKIVAVGKQGDVAIPVGAVVTDLPDAVIIPGLVDTHSHIGLWSRPSVSANVDGNESTGPIQPSLRAIDAINADDPGIKMAVAGGVTTANIMPGSGNAIGGQTVYVKLRGKTIEEMRIIDQKTLGGLKMANGENPKGYGRRGLAPATRMKIAALQREQFLKAREYKQKWQKYREATAKGDKAVAPETDLGLEALVEVLDHKRTVHFHCHRADDLMTAIRIAEEFDFDLVLQHGTEGYRIAEELAKRKIPVSLTLIDSPGGKLEVMGLLEETAAILEKAGVLIAFNTDDAITESRFFLRTGSIAVRGGLSEEAALRAVTINAAKMLKLDQRLGSLEKGKDADFAILSGAPFSASTLVLRTYIDGELRFDRANKRDWTYQAGGFALTDLGRLPDAPAPQKPLPPVKTPALASVDASVPMKSFAILAGRIHTVSGEPILDGAIIVVNGKIQSVGPANAIPIPKKFPIITAAEVTPGLIDAHTVCGLSGGFNVSADQDQDEVGDPNQADLRVLDGFNPNEPLIEFLRANGVTMVHAMPGRANVVAGQTGIFRTSGITVNESVVRFPAGLLVNLGESSKGEAKQPKTRMGSASIVRNAFVAGRDHLAKKERSRNPKLDALEPMLKGDLPVIFSAHRADDVATSLRLATEFKLKPILSLATEAYLIPEAVVASKAPVVVHPTMQRAGSSMETLNSFVGNAAFLADRKVPLALGTAFEGYVPKTRVLRSEASVAMAHGLGHAKALRAVTLDAARLLGLDKEYGSIEAGKIADLVLFDGDPLENAAHVTFTISQGRIVYSRNEYLKLPFSRRAIALSGGIGCCLAEW